MKNFIAPVVIILFAVVLRLIPHPPNFAPIAAMALFGGIYLDKKYALVVPFIAMLISDFFIGFHGTMPFVYASFLLIGWIGLRVRSYKSVQTIFFASLFASVLFYAITNFGVWLIGSMYPKTLSGLVQSYIYALPFFRNTLIGDLFYTGLFCITFELIKVVISRAWLQSHGLNNVKNPIKAKTDSSLHSE